MERFNLSTSASLLLVACVLAGCRRAEDPPVPPPPSQQELRTEAPPAPPPAPPTLPPTVNPSTPPAASDSPTNRTVLLQIKWPVGQRYVYRMDLDQKSTNRTEAPAQTTREQVNLGLTYALTVQPVQEEKSRELEVEFLAYEMEIRLDDELVIAFDTSTNAEPKNPVPLPFRRMIGSKVRLQVGPEGAVEKVIELDRWLRDMAGNASGPAGQMLVQQFNEGFFLQMAALGKALLPKPVAAGESWPYRTSTPAGELGTIDLDSTITFKEWTKQEQQEFAVLESRGTFRSQSTNSEPNLKLEEGTVSGVTWIDPQAGVLVEGTVEQFMRLKGTVPPHRRNPQPSGYWSEIWQKVVLKLAELTPRVAVSAP